MTQPTAVVVRLPLSEDDCGLLIDASSFGAPDDSHDKALLAIGTPVAGGELEVVCSIDEDILRDIRELDEDDEEYVTDMIFKPNPEGFDTVRLVRQSDAQAALAAAQVENARLRETIIAARICLSNGNVMKAAYVLEHGFIGQDIATCSEKLKEQHPGSSIQIFDDTKGGHTWGEVNQSVPSKQCIPTSEALKGPGA